ncbi:MAG: hypothetical protein QXF09_04390 [Nitrososphaerota archaeon]
MKEKREYHGRFKNKDKLAIDKVLSTIILISFTIILSFIVIFYAQNIIGFFIGYESIKIESVWVKDSVNNRTALVVILKNDGHTTVIIKDVFINNKEYKQFSPEAYVAIYFLDKVKILDPKDEYTYAKLEPKENAWVIISIPKEKIFSKQKIELRIKTEFSEYPVFVELNA